jgi:hypothetical protein
VTALFAEEIDLAKLTPDITPYWRFMRLSDRSDNRIQIGEHRIRPP